MLDLLADYEQHPDEYHDGTYREPPEHLRPGYIDFYRAQAYMFMTEAYANLSVECRVDSLEFATAVPHAQPSTAVANSKLYTLNSTLQKAKECLSLFEQTSYAKSFSARKDMAPTYGLLGEYDKMLAIHDEQEARLRQQGDTVCAEYATILRDRAMAAEARGRYAEANAYHRRYEALTATLNDRLLQGKANLYAARFHAAEQQREIERHKATSRYLGIVGSCIAVVAVLALLFAAYVIHKRRIVDQKNRALVKQIAEAAKYRKMQAEEVSTPLPHREGPGEGLLPHAIKSERLYLDPQFDRQAAIDRFGLSKERIGAAFAQGSEHASITDYINQLRLDHARELLTTRPDMSIGEVATASGFSVRRTFSRLFKEKFGLTPTEFREAASAEKKLA